MATRRARKRLVTILTALTLVLAVGLYAVAQQVEESKRQRSVPVAGGTYHVLPATLETTQWGWLDEDLDKAMVNATREAVNFLAAQKTAPLTRYEAYSLVSMVGDCRVTQVVDIRKGVHCMIPRSLFAKK